MRERARRLAARPTARGWQALFFGVLVLVAARLIGTTQFHQLAYALLGLLVASFALGLLGSRGLRFSRRLPPGTRVFAGDSARVVLSVWGGSRFGTSDLEVTDRLPEPRSFEAEPLSSGDEARIEVPLSFERRGVYELGPAEVRSTDPFGLLGFARRFEEKTEVVIYPRTHALPGFPLRGGEVEAGSRGAVGRRGDEFAGLREYRRGDELRHIHWKSVARTGELYVKEFSQQAPRRYAVALDLRRQGLRVPEAEVEDAVSVAASVLAHLRREGLPSRLLCANGEESATEFGADEASYWEAMRLLATVRADGRRFLSGLIADERAALGEGVVIVSRTHDEGLPEAVRKLRMMGLQVIVVSLATYSYLMPSGAGPKAQVREEEFLREAGSLEAAGAPVLVVRHPEGVAALSGSGAFGREAVR